MGVIGMKVLGRGILPQLYEDSLSLFIHYALSQSVNVIVVGADTMVQVRELAQAASEFEPQPRRTSAAAGRGPESICPEGDVL